VERTRTRTGTILEVLSEDTLMMIVISLGHVTPLIGKYNAIAHEAQSEWYALKGCAQLEEVNHCKSTSTPPLLAISTAFLKEMACMFSAVSSQRPEARRRHPGL